VSVVAYKRGDVEDDDEGREGDKDKLVHVEGESATYTTEKRRGGRKRGKGNWCRSEHVVLGVG
jgi:hypothetical protein